MDKVNNLFKDHCGITVKDIISVAYKIVGGVKYNIVFDTKYGPLNAIAVTQYWEKIVEIQ